MRIEIPGQYRPKKNIKLQKSFRGFFEPIGKNLNYSLQARNVPRQFFLFQMMANYCK